MASHVVVIAADLRRTTVKVSPGTYLTDVLQQACTTFKLPSNKYLLKHKQKIIDLSYPFRTAGLVTGAKLELVQKANTPSVVQVALQVPLPEGKEIPGGRLISKFPSDMSLWTLMRQFESGQASAGRNINITSRGVASTSKVKGAAKGQLYYEMPVLNLMEREVSSFVDFHKSLSQMGYNSGSVLIRLSFRRTEQILYDAMQEIGRYFKLEEEQKTSDSKPPTEMPAEAKETPDSSSHTKMEASTLDSPSNAGSQANASNPTSDVPMSNAMDVDEPTPQSYDPVNVFLAPTSETPAAAKFPEEDSDFTPTVAHAQLHQARLLESSRNKRLLSDKELEEKSAAENAKVAAVKSVTVKVRFPDNTSTDWQIGPLETGAFLHEAVRHVMSRPEQPFRLVLPGTKTVIQDDAGAKHTLIRGYKLTGRVLIGLIWDDRVPPEVRKQPFLKSSVAQQGQTIKVQKIPDARDNGPADASTGKTKDKTDKDDGSGKRKLPKWLKFGKK